MASLSMLSFNIRCCPLLHSSSPNKPISTNSLKLATFNKATNSLKLSSTHSIGSNSLITSTLFTTHTKKLQSFTVFAAKGYKMKTHKASAKRFRVTGRGKIVRRRAGKQHLLAKKNTKRKLRLSKMIAVSKSDYDNVIGAMPYLKVKRIWSIRAFLEIVVFIVPPICSLSVPFPLFCNFIFCILSLS
ncbi:hypothetical protein ACFE04_009139 [Oxalis oulophora]